MLKKLRLNSLIVLVLLTTALPGCSDGRSHSKTSKIVVTEKFIDDLIAEQRIIDKCCKATASVVDDWIVQNEP